MKTRLLLNSLIFFLIILFTYTAINKLIDWKNFKEVLSRMPFIDNYSIFIAIAIPASELLLAVALAFSRDVRYALWGSLSLLTIFTLYIIWLLNFAPHLPCSCGGVIEQLNWQQHLAFNTLLIIINLIAIRLSRRQVVNKLQ